MQRIQTTLVILAVVVAAGLLTWWCLSPEVGDSRVAMRQAAISRIEPMVRLCTVDIYQDLPIRGHVGKNHIFARCRLEGSISFDIEKLAHSMSGDTLVVKLPPEIVELREATEPNSYEVIDRWSEKFLGSGAMTAAQENSIKRQAIEKYRQRLYRDGIVSRARASASRRLASMLTTATQGPVLVIE